MHKYNAESILHDTKKLVGVTWYSLQIKASFKHL